MNHSHVHTKIIIFLYLYQHISLKALVAQWVHPLRVNTGGLVTTAIQEKGLRVDQSYHLIMINLKCFKALPFH